LLTVVAISVVVPSNPVVVAITVEEETAIFALEDVAIEDVTMPVELVSAAVEVSIAEVVSATDVLSIAGEVVSGGDVLFIPAEVLVAALLVVETLSTPTVAASVEVVEDSGVMLPLEKSSKGYSLVLKSSSPVSTNVSPLAERVILPFP
jgi:hypothetical protein